MGELPHDVDWSFVFRIDPDGNVSRVSSTSLAKRFHQMHPIPDPLYSENGIQNGVQNENQKSGQQQPRIQDPRIPGKFIEQLLT